MKLLKMHKKQKRAEFWNVIDLPKDRIQTVALEALLKWLIAEPQTKQIQEAVFQTEKLLLNLKSQNQKAA